MKKFIKNIVKDKIHKRGLELVKPDDFLIVPKVEKEKIVALVKSLRPYDVGIDLIRFGPAGDGGYLIPNDLEGIKALFSPGVADLSGFEEDCANKGMQLFLADGSVDAPQTKLNKDRFLFQKKFIGSYSNKEFMTMEEWMKESKVNDEDDLMLQMDIEGHEYFTLINTSEETLKRFRIVVIELHRLQRVLDKDYYNMFVTAMHKLMLNHTCVHLHVNNCCGSETHYGIEIPKIMEFTFIRNDRFKHSSPQVNMPHPLDADNTQLAHLPLPECWYRD